MDLKRKKSSGEEREADGKGGVRRVNNVPLLLVGAVLLIFVGLIVMVGLKRMDESKSGSGRESIGTDSNLASSVMSAADNMNGLVPDGAAQETSLGVVRDPDAPPPPPADGDDKLRDARMAMLQKAIMAKTRLTSSAAKPGDGRQEQPGQAPPPRPGGPLAPPGAARPSPSGPPASRVPGVGGDAPYRADNNYAKFDNADGGDRWWLGNTTEKPHSPFELRAGFVIPAILMSGVNSELPGQIIGQVSEDVYDTPTGKHKLIPQGTRLVGTYNSDVAYGQSRVLIAWQRLVFPDGRAMDIGAMPGTSSDGYSGFKDKVNNHYVRIFGSALLMSGVIAGVTKVNNDTNNDPFGTSTGSILSQSIARELSNVTTQLIRKNLNISPTLEIRPGYRFNVMVVKDLNFPKPYRAFDY